MDSKRAFAISADTKGVPITSKRLKGKIAIVTASTDGIGFAIAKRLSQEGAKVIISSRSQKNVDAAVSKLKNEDLDVVGLVCHVSKEEDRKRLFNKAKEMGGLDILVSNAAINPALTRVVEIDEKTFNKILQVNVGSSFSLAKEAYPLLKERKNSNITFISSAAAYQHIKINIGAYAVSKTALLGLTKVLATELIEDGIRVNCVAPGVIPTKFGKFITNNPVYAQLIKHHTLINRLGTPEDISGVVAFVVSDDAQFITGETIVAAGGVHSRL